MSQRPVVVGLLLCESLIVEEGTHNVTLVNCFTTRKAEQFPSEPHRFTAFAVLTNGLGEVTIDVTIEHLEDYGEVYRQSRRLRFTDPLQEVRFILRITQCSFPTAGAYEINLSADGESLAAHRFQVW